MVRALLQAFAFVCILLVPSSAATRRALLIGIEQYNPGDGKITNAPTRKSTSRKELTSGDVRHWTYHNLQGPLNDVKLMEGLLLAPEFGFQASDIVKLITPDETTAEAILTALRRELVETTARDDVRLVYYSGHGNFIRNAAIKRKNPNARNEFDQTIVASDQWQGAVDVRDKEIARILWDAAQKGVTVTFIADSCHSGSLTRGPASVRGEARSNAGSREGEDGANFGEPAIDDPPSIDPATGKEIDPQTKGVLTLAAAQENQEALEIYSEKQYHGAMTMALVRAVREEGPRASMDRIFERMSNYLKAADLTQTPVLGGKGRGARDLLGRPAREEPFSVLVKSVENGEALLGGGDAIGLFAGSELRPAGARSGRVVVVKSLGLTESAATIAAGTTLAAGDRLEVTKWAAPDDPNLRVYVPPPAETAAIAQMAERLAALRDDASIHWVDDPTAESPTDILRWSGSAWVVDHLGKQVKTSDLGASPSAADIKRAAPAGGRFFALMPPDGGLSAAIALGEGTRYPGIQRLRGADAKNADYRLYGRVVGTKVQYAWVRADAEIGSRKSTAAGSSLPARTDWVDGAAPEGGDTLTEFAVRIGKVHAWLTLGGRPGQAAFPYSLVLRKSGSNANVRGGVVYGGEKYGFFLQLDPKYASRTSVRRWVYVFGIDQKGDGKLVFPSVESGNEGNHLPRAEKDESASATAVPLIDLESGVEVGEPYGTDTYILISTREPVTNLSVFNLAGVQSRGMPASGGGTGLDELLATCGDSSRGFIVSKAPSEWSIDRLVLLSARKK